MDWNTGRYEDTAARLLPAARVVVDRADPRPGDRVVDVGCGTGNAALVAAARGCRVVGIDPAGRLLDVARQEAARRRLDAEFVQGTAAALPLGDATADVVLSVFAVIFAEDPAAAAAEMARVTTAHGRIVLSAWVPEGAMHDCVGVLQQAVGQALGGATRPPPFPWHSEPALSRLFGPHGFTVTVEEERLPFTAPSAHAYLHHELRHHPMALAGGEVLERAGIAERVFERALATLERANEDPEAFRVTSRYVVATAGRG